MRCRGGAGDIQPHPLVHYCIGDLVGGEVGGGNTRHLGVMSSTLRYKN